MTDLDKRISEYAKWIESRYDDSHELRGKDKNGYIDGKADAYESSLREFKRIFNVKEEYDGMTTAYEHVINYCRHMLGYSGTMPSEVPNQSEDAKE